MNRLTFAIAAAIVLSALAITLPRFESNVQANPAAEAAAAPFGDACKNVHFKFTNQHHEGGQIQFRRIKYFNKANGDWQTEDVANTTCNQGSTCTTTGDNLSDSEGEDLTKFRLVYKFKGKGAAANWSDEVESGELTPTNPTCNANKTYGPGSQGWLIK
ncbi:MAG TPA: hypothetical protein VJ302_13260 [Blastocatellia bacterium]|nr:hypothetical protein [Blastocatellia bacterium]